MSTSYSPNIVTNGLVLYLDAANSKSIVSGSNTWRDISGNNLSGSLVNGPTYNGANKGSIVFDGTNDYISTNLSGTLTAMTMMCYIKRNGNQPAWTGIFYSRPATGGQAAGLDFRDTTHQLVYTWGFSPNTYNFVSNLVIPDNQWCMVGISLNSTKADLYLNTNVATNNLNHDQFTINAGDLKIGNDFDGPTPGGPGGRIFKGNIGLAVMYNRALSSQEVLQNYNSTKGRYGL